jgi:hypothetical protein
MRRINILDMQCNTTCSTRRQLPAASSPTALFPVVLDDLVPENHLHHRGLWWLCVEASMHWSEAALGDPSLRGRSARAHAPASSPRCHGATDCALGHKSPKGVQSFGALSPSAGWDAQRKETTYIGGSFLIKRAANAATTVESPQISPHRAALSSSILAMYRMPLAFNVLGRTLSQERRNRRQARATLSSMKSQPETEVEVLKVEQLKRARHI